MIEYQNVLTTCPFCGVGCGINLQVLDGRVVGVLPAKNHPLSRGGLCIKGWNAHAFIYHPERLTRPLVRRAGRLEPISWEEALDLVAARFAAITRRSGPGSFACLSSAKATNEENYVLQKFARAVIGTNNIDHCARL